MPTEHDPLDQRCADFYCRAMAALARAEVPFLVGGAFALQTHAGIARFTKDLDIFLRESDMERALEALGAQGLRTELTASHWLAKAYADDLFVDLIYGSGNGMTRVDDGWFEHAVSAEVLGMPAKLVPAEEMIWSKAFVQERERFDGADIAHILRARATALDWPRLLDRFGDRWRVLLAHLVLFGFIYPGERHKVPAAVMRTLLARLASELDAGDQRGRGVTRGTLLSREQYLVDLEDWGYRDARLLPPASMEPEEIDHWTELIGSERPEGT